MSSKDSTNPSVDSQKGINLEYYFHLKRKIIHIPTVGFQMPIAIRIPNNLER